MKHDWRDHALRGAILLAGAAAALIFMMNGGGETLPYLALGGALGATLVSAGTDLADRE